MMVPNNALILAADGGQYCLFRNAGHGFAIELDVLAEAHLANPKTSDRGSDAPGRTRQSIGKHRAAYDQKDLHEAEEAAFVSSAVNRLEDYARDSASSIILIADPRTLGRLREELSDSVQSRVALEVSRDYAMRQADDIVELLKRMPSA